MRKDGITLVEVLIASAIMVVILGGGLTVYLMSETTWQESTVQARLQRSASIVMQKMIKGVEGVYGLRDSKAITTPSYPLPASSDTVEFTGIGNISRSFYLEENAPRDEVFYDPNTSVSGDAYSIAADISSLTFERLTMERIRISLTMSQAVGDKDMSISLNTDVTIRN